MTFNDELKFEKDVINLLTENGWEKEVLKNKTEEDLIQNWANILFENNNVIDRLNGYPLTRGEMSQIIDQIKELRTPLKLNGFINGGSVSIKRDNANDTLHFGKEISLKIYDRAEIIGGQSRYQIAEQPIFKAKNSIYPNRRGDFMLLINGMPLYHVELKKSGVPISQACNQIKKYAHEGVYTGLFVLVQIFVAMNPEETKYFANPGPDGVFDEKYFFHRADFNNNHINDFKQITSTLLHIPTAHQLIGFYTVADNSDGVLKVMRSYQYYAANGIADKVAKTHWENKNIYGGYVWHTTGSGKTMTSFKSACLIANSKDADKVVFLMDRIELGTQSLREYRGFADELTEVQETEDTYVLIDKLKSNKPKDTLIVTSIQKMSNIKEDSVYKKADIDLINKKRVVFVVDECHRSTFGEMLADIKSTFPRAIFFGFTGTPIHQENRKKDTTTSMIFGNEIHRYSISDGINDGNVLGFDPVKVCTYKDIDLRKKVALKKSNSIDINDAYSHDEKKKIYEQFMNNAIIRMAGYVDKDGNQHPGIEDYVPMVQYDRDEHREAVVKDILDNWQDLSKMNKYHAILATNSIPEAIKYYRLLKKKKAKNLINIKFTALFDQNIDNNGDNTAKEDAVVEILNDYNEEFGQTFTISTFKKFKNDVCARLAHKKPYLYIQNEPKEQLNLLIVVDQMLTGFDSKRLNTLYLDKVLRYENIIQAFSRTNRLAGNDKPFGIIRYYRKPHTMQLLIEDAFKLYSGDKPFGIFVDKLEKNLNKINKAYINIVDIFKDANIDNFKKLPDDIDEIKQFALQFKNLNQTIESAKIQGFKWSKNIYEFVDENDEKHTIECLIDEETFNVLLQRYREIPKIIEDGCTVPFDLDYYLIENNTGTINADWMNARFKKYLVALQTGVDVDKAKEEVAKTFATLSQEEQKYANIFLHDIESGEVKVESNKTLKDYITEYQERAKNDQIHKFAIKIGVDESRLRDMMRLNINSNNINEFGRFDQLKETVNRDVAKIYFDTLDNENYSKFRVNQKIDEILREFILSGGFNI